MKNRIFVFILIVSISLSFSCSLNSEIDYMKIPFIEMTTDSLSRILPDSFLNTGGFLATTINLSRVKNNETEYEDAYSFDPSNGILTKMRLYSDGDYYVTEYGFEKTKITREITYVDNMEKKILRSYSFEYGKDKNQLINAIDDKNNTTRSYKVFSNKNNIIIQLFNSSNEMDREFIYIYEKGKLVSITRKSPRVNTILKTILYYYDDKVAKTEFYSISTEEDEDGDRLLSKKDYYYNNDGKFVALTQTNYLKSETSEIYETSFENHDINGNWTVMRSDDNRIYIREIIYD